VKRVIAIVSIIALATMLIGMLGGMFRPCPEKSGSLPLGGRAGEGWADTLTLASFSPQPEDAQTRFQAIDLFIDPQNQPLAAYQLDFHATRGTIRIVGIEGGEHGAFNKAPYYDPKAIQNDHILLAAYSLADAPTLPGVFPDADRRGIAGCQEHRGEGGVRTSIEQQIERARQGPLSNLLTQHTNHSSDRGAQA
jgi:hypothetical protein